MKIALLLVAYERPEYLKECLESLERADLSEIWEVLIIDDASKDAETLKLISNLSLNLSLTVWNNSQNKGIKQNLLAGFNHLFQFDDLVINLDSDALVRNDFIERLIENYIPGTLLTGFHSTTMGRHEIIGVTKDHYIKQSTGGINFCVDKSAYENFVKPALEYKEQGNWDAIASHAAGQVYCLKHSVIQHIGFESTLGHHDNPDTADTFKPLYIDATLLGVDINNERLQSAKEICTKDIAYAEIVTINPELHSKEEYSRFMVKEAYKYIKSDHVLIFQYDGFVNNYKAWDNNWLQYDYIGAPWYYTDGMNVGNGGFSFRSRRLMEIVATDPFITELHPEDYIICRVYRKYLETKYGIKYAPDEVAEKFAFEGYRQPSKYLSDQFGVHGANPRTSPILPYKARSEKYVVNQYLSLGDILFLIPMIRALIDEGNTILWPIDDRYFDIKKHFPDLPFVKKSDYPDLPYNSKQRVQTQHGVMLPYRFASEIMGRKLTYCMQSKYDLYQHNYLIWRSLYWERDYKNEKRLILLLQLPDKFILVNRAFGHEAAFIIELSITSDLPIVEMRNIEGFTLIDWLGVVELASEIHASNSSLNYLIELMALDIPVHLYPRKIWGENAFEYTRGLFLNKCFVYHE